MLELINPSKKIMLKILNHHQSIYTIIWGFYNNSMM
jgi:hypothetical protein